MSRSLPVAALALAAGGALCGACGEEGGGPGPLLPADHRAAGYLVVRGCRPSVEHDLAHVVVLASPAAVRAYDEGPFPLPPGTLIVKEEYADTRCSALQGFTLMHKEAPGYDAPAGDWRWQKVDRERRVLQDGRLRRCAGCHTPCRARDFVCAEP